MLTRRGFLYDAARAAVAGTAGFALLANAGCGVNAVPSIAPANRWSELARRLKGDLLRPGDAGFTARALPNNLRYASIVPAGIALCENSDDVSTSILWAREFGVPLIARSGGHSYAGYSTTTGLMIDLDRMRTMRYDPSTGIATFGGGSRNGDVFRDLRPVNRAITHGRCHGVGIAGLVLGGGVGFNQRAHGVTSDQLIETEIVTADGKIRNLNKTQNQDLFWACRGAGGGNFGIHTSFSFQTFPVDLLTVYELHWTHRPDDVFRVLLSVLDRAPETLGCKVSVVAPTIAQRSSGMGLTIELLGQLRGTPPELATLLQPVYEIAEPAGTIRQEKYWEGQDFLSEAGLPEFFHESSRFFNEPIPEKAISLILDRMRRWPGMTKTAAFKLFQTGGAMNAIPSAVTAFVHRSSLWLSSIGLVWDNSDSAASVREGLAWQKDLYNAYIPFASGGAYQNFIDPSLADWKRAYYGSNLPRLEAVKARVDPERVFRFPEAIP